MAAKLKSKLGIVLLLGMAGTLGAQDLVRGGKSRTDRDQLPRPVFKVAQKAPEDVASNPTQPTNVAAVPQAEHPLVPALEMAYKCVENIQTNIQDYSATMVKRERVDGKLLDHEYLFIKVRHQPFSAYTYFKAPERLKGQEALYVAGKNNGNLLGHGVGVRGMIGTLALKPDSMLAMQNNRYPITEIGILNLSKRLIEVGELDKQYGECEVKFFKGAKINNRLCTCIQVVHPVPRRNFRFHMARIFIDDELNVPVRYEAYEWPTEAGGKPPLLEEYTYVDIKVNQGFTDADFDEHNKSYGFH